MTSLLSHVELPVQPEPAFAMAGGEPEEAMAEERATGTTGRPLPPPRAPDAAPAPAIALTAPASGRPARAPLGRHPAQRPLPLRLRQKIQALPRPGVAGNARQRARGRSPFNECRTPSDTAPPSGG